MSIRVFADLQEITVRPDWEAAEEQARAEAARRRVAFEVVLLTYGAITIGLSTWANDAAWSVLAQWLFFGVVLLLAPLWIALAGQPDRSRIVPRYALAVSVAIALAILTTPAEYRSIPIPGLPTLDPRLALAIPFITGGLLAHASERYPSVRRTLGLQEPYVGRQVVIGLALGVALGLHMVSTILFMPGVMPVPAPGLTNLAWLVGVCAGLFAVGQEISLRGVLHTLLGPRPGMGQVPAWATIILLNFLLYVAPLGSTTLTTTLLVCFVYEIGFAFLAGALRLRSGSVVSPMAANAALSVFLLMAFLG